VFRFDLHGENDTKYRRPSLLVAHCSLGTLCQKNGTEFPGSSVPLGIPLNPNGSTEEILQLAAKDCVARVDRDG
jgi:hypothetical protein